MAGSGALLSRHYFFCPLRDAKAMPGWDHYVRKTVRNQDRQVERGKSGGYET